MPKGFDLFGFRIIFVGSKIAPKIKRLKMEEKKDLQQPKGNPGKENTAGSGKSGSGMKVIIAIVAILLIVVTWLYIDQRSTTQEIKQVLTEEKNSIEESLLNLRSEYDSLRTNNDTLNSRLVKEQGKIDELLTELKTVKATNYRRIRQLQTELSTLRDVAKSYVRQIDSLNTRNQELVAENTKVKSQMRKTLSDKRNLEEQNQDLSTKVEKASVLSTANVQAMPINSRGKEKNKVDKVDKVKVTFNIKENVLAEPGERDVYMRIAGPDDFILAKSEDDLFDYQGEMIVFSAKRPVEYYNDEVPVTIYWKNDGELIVGKYDVYLFADGYEIGYTTFTIEDSGWF
jgi:uncharacterized coiled-coil DUF342 family protein